MTVLRQVLLQPVLPARPEFLVLDLVGEDKLSGGVATWSTLNRPRRRDAIQFDGVTGFTYVLPLLINGLDAAPGVDLVVEPRVQVLQSWASSVQTTRQPVVLRATGPLQTPETVRWVITGLDWGAKVRDNRGRRIQQYVTVTLTQYVTAVVRKSAAKRSRDRKGKDKANGKKPQGKPQGKSSGKG
ncbi:hypothetical protein [Nocardioides soli]|uniref:Uncharacterized protein n=1 Tax=Nocardioides soli TaxID=1036020 RepID=A0A7W4YZK0_9ACTN|nr:hypothetical protein [Nocardioides soli]MBB3041027.1 hypothetical protein [Nocardioides soli]